MAWSRDGLGLPGDVRDTPVNVPHPPIPATWKMLSSSETCGVGRSCKMESGVATRRWAATCATLTSRCLQPSHPRPSRRNPCEIRLSNDADKAGCPRRQPEVAAPDDRHQAERIRKIMSRYKVTRSSVVAPRGRACPSDPCPSHCTHGDIPAQSPFPPPTCRREQKRADVLALHQVCDLGDWRVGGDTKRTIRHYLMSSARSGVLRFQCVTTRCLPARAGRAAGFRRHDTSRPMRRSVSRESAR